MLSYNLPVMRVLAFAIFLLPAAQADVLDLTYTVAGEGGQSSALSPISNSPFWWVDSSIGAVSVQDNPDLVPPGWSGPLNGGSADFLGSTLLSSQFDLSSDASIDVHVKWMTPDPFPWYADVFVILLKDSSVDAILLNEGADGRNFVGDLRPPDEATYVPTTPGVIRTGSPQLYGSGVGPFGSPLQDLTLGGQEYVPSYCADGRCGYAADMTLSFTPGAGTYQLLFGSFIESGGPLALAVDSVDVDPPVPEPGSRMFLVALFALAVAARLLKLPAPCKNGLDFRGAKLKFGSWLPASFRA